MSNWYLQNGKDSDVVVSSRVRLVRNLKGFKYLNKCTKPEQEKILEIIKEIVPSIGYGLKYIDLNDLDDITKVSLVEKNLISPDFITDDKTRKAILINDEENICIMINDEDHLKMQVFSSGQELENLMNLIIEIDEKIGEMVNYSYSKRFGYLSASPINIGIDTAIAPANVSLDFLPSFEFFVNLSTKLLDTLNNKAVLTTVLKLLLSSLSCSFTSGINITYFI